MVENLQLRSPQTEWQKASYKEFPWLIFESHLDVEYIESAGMQQDSSLPNCLLKYFTD